MNLLLNVITFRRSGKMAAAPRQNKKATKIAFSILGTPANLRSKRSAHQEWVNKMLSSQETSRVR